MTVPTYDKFIEPILRYRAGHPDGALARIAAVVAYAAGLARERVVPVPA